MNNTSSPSASFPMGQRAITSVKSIPRTVLSTRRVMDTSEEYLSSCDADLDTSCFILACPTRIQSCIFAVAINGSNSSCISTAQK
eukprot:CAMPEP_0114241870 /NCGR_PEP_ID=MMETSP0058-20121206/9863_1 /TAXON_ID=36894 /ORGANISM="Pyramimonas parkeae, CCMP726" /LENGTH=84 /DNA_ID=CAMNT_0001354425 /DNA_START=727 /DNA_END=981 /DNA_ORIENTATION=+